MLELSFLMYQEEEYLAGYYAVVTLGAALVWFGLTEWAKHVLLEGPLLAIAYNLVCFYDGPLNRYLFLAVRIQ